MSRQKLVYMIRSPAGQEFGPVTQDIVIQWAKEGRITADHALRNTLLNRWVGAEEVNFIEVVWAIHRTEIVILFSILHRGSAA